MPFAPPSFYTINNDVSCKLASQLCKQPLLRVSGLRLEVSETLSWTLRPPSGPPLGALWTVAGAPERLWGCSWTCFAASLAPLESLLGTKTAHKYVCFSSPGDLEPSGSKTCATLAMLPTLLFCCYTSYRGVGVT